LARRFIMAYAAIDPVITGFEQPSTMSPAGQQAAYRSQVPVSSKTVATRYSQPMAGVGIGAGAGYIGFGAGEMQQQQPQVAGALAAIPAAAGALGISLPAGILAALGIGGAIYGGLQALGLGEGGGLFDNNLLGGDDFTLGGLEFGGPGLPEPMQPYTEWHSGNKQFYYVPQYTPTGKFRNAKVAMYNRDTKRWKVWTLPKPHLAVIGKNAPSHRMLTRLRQNLRRHTADAKTVLAVASPAYYAKMNGYYKKRRRR